MASSSLMFQATQMRARKAPERATGSMSLRRARAPEARTTPPAIMNTWPLMKRTSGAWYIVYRSNPLNTRPTPTAASMAAPMDENTRALVMAVAPWVPMPPWGRRSTRRGRKMPRATLTRIRAARPMRMVTMAKVPPTPNWMLSQTPAMMRAEGPRRAMP